MLNNSIWLEVELVKNVKKFKFVLTSGKLHKMPQVRYNLEPICGKVAVTGDRTSPLSLKKW